MQTVLITGCSSGFGLETARYFLHREWAVVATMRHLREDVLPPSDRLRIIALDVTNPASIEQAITAAGADRRPCEQCGDRMAQRAGGHADGGCA